MNKTSQTKLRVRSYFEKAPAKPVAIDNLKKHFNDVKEANLIYHLKTLIDEGFLVRPHRGSYQKNPEHVSIEERREILNNHLQTGERVIKGEDWRPGQPSITAVQNPAMIAYLGRTFGESILERMRMLGTFTKIEINFVTTLLAEKYPLSEQQRNVIEQAEKIAQNAAQPKHSPSTNGSLVH